MTDEQTLNPPASRPALPPRSTPGTPGEYRAPGVAWDAEELERMHAALEAPDVDAALEAFGTAPGSWLPTPGLGDPRRGGGGGQSPYDAAVRELKEELGLTCAPGRLLAVDWVPPAAPEETRTQPKVRALTTRLLSAPTTPAMSGLRDFAAAPARRSSPPQACRKTTGCRHSLRPTDPPVLTVGNPCRKSVPGNPPGPVFSADALRLLAGLDR